MLDRPHQKFLDRHAAAAHEQPAPWVERLGERVQPRFITLVDIILFSQDERGPTPRLRE